MVITLAHSLYFKWSLNFKWRTCRLAGTLPGNSDRRTPGNHPCSFALIRPHRHKCCRTLLLPGALGTAVVVTRNVRGLSLWHKPHFAPETSPVSYRRGECALLGAWAPSIYPEQQVHLRTPEKHPSKASATGDGQHWALGNEYRSYC